MNKAYTVKLICLKTNKVIESFSSNAIGLAERKEAFWYQTKANIKVEWIE